MRWVLRGYDRLTEIPLGWWCYLPGEYEPEEIAAELGLDEIPYDGFMVTTRRVGDAIARMIGRPLDLDANEYVVGNTAEGDWLLAESRKQRLAANDDRTEHWVILGFDKITERLVEYVELPASISEDDIVRLIGNFPDPRYKGGDATASLLDTAEKEIGRTFDTSRIAYMVEFQRDREGLLESV
jgi:hypothetical protein